MDTMNILSHIFGEPDHPPNYTGSIQTEPLTQTIISHFTNYWHVWLFWIIFWNFLYQLYPTKRIYFPCTLHTLITMIATSPIVYNYGNFESDSTVLWYTNAFIINGIVYFVTDTVYLKEEIMIWVFHHVLSVSLLFSALLVPWTIGCLATYCFVEIGGFGYHLTTKYPAFERSVSIRTVVIIVYTWSRIKLVQSTYHILFISLKQEQSNSYYFLGLFQHIMVGMTAALNLVFLVLSLKLYAELILKNLSKRQTKNN